MPQDDTREPPHQQDGDPKHPARWARFRTFLGEADRSVSFVKGLSAVTILSSLFVAYFQYLNAYNDKVSLQAKEDMTAATTTFMDISNAFSEAQTLQQLLYFNFAAALDDQSESNPQALTTKNGREIFPSYEHARALLRQNSDILARRAEIYIDWASDLNRDPAETRTPNTDPLTQPLLGAYNFDCEDSGNFPHFENVTDKKKTGFQNPDQNPCVVEDQKNYDPDKSYINLCARRDGKIVPNKSSITIHWYSTKHQVMIMHYCFQVAHARLAAAREWASQSDLSEQKKARFLAERDQARAELDNEVIRLNAFMSLAMFQIEKIRVKYRPVSFVCHVPLVSYVTNLIDGSCSPIRTASSHMR